MTPEEAVYPCHLYLSLIAVYPCHLYHSLIAVYILVILGAIRPFQEGHNLSCLTCIAVSLLAPAVNVE
jgi:low affinity Fe/Cu permease